MTIQESGKAGQALPDESVLAFACAEGRMLVTYNRKHFIHYTDNNMNTVALSYAVLMLILPHWLSAFTKLFKSNWKPQGRLSG